MTTPSLTLCLSLVAGIAYYQIRGMGGKVRELTMERIRWLENRVPHIHGPVEVEG